MGLTGNQSQVASRRRSQYLNKVAGFSGTEGKQVTTRDTKVTEEGSTTKDPKEGAMWFMRLRASVSF